jgi:hypothetical protein
LKKAYRTQYHRTFTPLAHTLQLVRVIAHRHEQLIARAHQLLTSLAQMPEAYAGDPAACRTLFVTLLQGHPL